MITMYEFIQESLRQNGFHHLVSGHCSPVPSTEGLIDELKLPCNTEISSLFFNCSSKSILFIQFIGCFFINQIVCVLDKKNEYLIMYKDRFLINSGLILMNHTNSPGKESIHLNNQSLLKDIEVVKSNQKCTNWALAI